MLYASIVITLLTKEVYASDPNLFDPDTNSTPHIQDLMFYVGVIIGMALSTHTRNMITVTKNETQTNVSQIENQELEIAGNDYSEATEMNLNHIEEMKWKQGELLRSY